MRVKVSVQFGVLAHQSYRIGVFSRGAIPVNGIRGKKDPRNAGGGDKFEQMVLQPRQCLHDPDNTICSRLRRYHAEGMSDFAPTKRLRGMNTIFSSGPHPAVSGSESIRVGVTSMPIMAKSPDSNSQMSGHLFSAMDCAPLA